MSLKNASTSLSMPVEDLYCSYFPGFGRARQSKTYPPPFPEESAGMPFLYEKLYTDTSRSEDATSIDHLSEDGAPEDTSSIGPLSEDGTPEDAPSDDILLPDDRKANCGKSTISPSTLTRYPYPSGGASRILRRLEIAYGILSRKCGLRSKLPLKPYAPST